MLSYAWTLLCAYILWDTLQWSMCQLQMILTDAATVCSLHDRRRETHSKTRIILPLLNHLDESLRRTMETGGTVGMWKWLVPIRSATEWCGSDRTSAGCAAIMARRRGTAKHLHRFCASQWRTVGTGRTAGIRKIIRHIFQICSSLHTGQPPERERGELTVIYFPLPILVNPRPCTPVFIARTCRGVMHPLRFSKLHLAELSGKTELSGKASGLLSTNCRDWWCVFLS